MNATQPRTTKSLFIPAQDWRFFNKVKNGSGRQDEGLLATAILTLAFAALGAAFAFALGAALVSLSSLLAAP